MPKQIMRRLFRKRTLSKRHGLDLLAIEAKDVILLTQPTKDALVCDLIATCLSKLTVRRQSLEVGLVDADVLAQKMFEIDHPGDELPRPTLSDRFRTAKEEAKAELEAMNGPATKKLLERAKRLGFYE